MEKVVGLSPFSPAEPAATGYEKKDIDRGAILVSAYLHSFPAVLQVFHTARWMMGGISKK